MPNSIGHTPLGGNMILIKDRHHNLQQRGIFDDSMGNMILIKDRHVPQFGTGLDVCLAREI